MGNGIVMEEARARERVLDVAREWLGTPYHHRAMLKGQAADCATFVLGVLIEAGAIPQPAARDDLVTTHGLPDYGAQWFLNRDDELYLNNLPRFGFQPVERPRPADLALFRIGRTFSHAAIVIAWPEVIHCLERMCVQTDDALRFSLLAWEAPGKPRPVKFFSLWGHA